MLGEGCQVSECKNFLAWVDILDQTIYLHDLVNSNCLKYKITTTPSAILKLNTKHAEILDDIGIIRFYFEDMKIERVKTFYEYSQNPQIRANDGSYRENEIFFGTMFFDPKAKSGSLYKFTANKLEKFDDIGIPNTFISLDEGMLISDSLEKRIYIYDYKTLKKYLWLDLSDTNMTPDGGCIAKNGNIYICMWGDGSILEISKDAEIINKHKVPVKNPTKCICLDNNLFFTSALLETDSVKKNKKNSLDGNTFIAEI